MDINTVWAMWRGKDCFTPFVVWLRECSCAVLLAIGWSLFLNLLNVQILTHKMFYFDEKAQLVK